MLEPNFARSHFAVYSGDNRIIHYQKVLGKHAVIEETIQQFFQREGFGNVKKAELGSIHGRMDKPLTRDVVVKNARHHLGHTYTSTSCNIVFENSEDFANWCKYKVKPISEVERRVPTVAILAGVVGVSLFIGQTIQGTITFILSRMASKIISLFTGHFIGDWIGDILSHVVVGNVSVFILLYFLGRYRLHTRM